jgi:phospholipid/cholesterol/gamma-HCH transport system permease protein
MKEQVLLRVEELNGFEKFLYSIQSYTLTSVEIIRGFKTVFKYRIETLREMYLIGAQSFPIVFIGGLFVGIIMALEVGHRFEAFGAKILVGRTVALGLVREMGPVISGLLLAARTGAKNATEIGAMKLSEQIDALQAFGVSPINKLVVPRTVASIIMFFPLILMADVVGILGGMIVSNLWLNIDTSFYWHSAINGLKDRDLIVGFIKPIFFGYFIGSISCFYGLNTSGGTRGLGRATINAVVVSCVGILILDFIFTKVLWELL